MHASPHHANCNNRLFETERLRTRHRGGRDPALPEAEAPGHHTPEFRIDDRGLDLGVRVIGSRTVREPRAVLAEFGLKLGKEIAIRVHDSTADMRYIVLPMRPAGTEGWSEEQLAEIRGRIDRLQASAPAGALLRIQRHLEQLRHR